MKQIPWVMMAVCSSFVYADGFLIDHVENFWMWALFALGMISLMIFYFTSKQSKQMRKIENMHQEMMQKQQKIEHAQSLFLANISENIHEMIEMNYRRSEGEKEVFDEGQEVVRGKKLLDITNDLIEFLRLKSKKVEITHEKFNLNNVLNEVAGSVCSKFKGSSVELIFDINNTIPRYLIGDALNLEKSLHNLLEYVLSNVDSGEVILEITMFRTYEEKAELQFKLTDTGAGLSSHAIETLFTPVYDENSKTYQGLGLFVAKELISMMKGELIVHSIEEKGTTFTVTLPFGVLGPEHRRKYRLPEKILTTKKVLIVDRNYNSALAIKKKFAYFRHDIKVLTREEFLKTMPNRNDYDIFVLDESLFNARTANYLQKLKQESDIKVIALNSLLEKDEETVIDPVVDRILSKPVNQERVFELIVNLYTINRLKPEKTPGSDVGESALTHREDIVEAADITQIDFKDFSGARLLIVEDDVINQKVLSNILKLSNMKITIANNGREAVNIVKKSDVGFDMVLMDINMPIMDGYVATQMIRLDSRFDELPIVSFTALALESEREKIFNCGMNAYLTKPINIGKLYTVFSMYLPMHRVSSSSPSQENREKRNILDVLKGIRHANGNEAFYMEVLREFLDAYGESDTLFKKLIEEDRYEQVKMLCLDMKGLTGTIGAKEMYGLISNIHQKILYHEEETMEEYVEAYMQEFQILKDEIKRYLVS